MLQLKKDLYNYCLSFATERINAAKKAIILAQEASVDDTKSSAGDKYETTREMMQQEISRNQAQLHEANKLKIALSALNSDKLHTVVQAGSIVKTNHGNFYISISAGQIKISDQTFFAISPVSPMGKALMNLKKGTEFEFNQKHFKILEIA